MVCPIISLTTDFGLRDPYVAEMKAVILGICANARIVDVSHEIDKFSVRMGAFVLASATPYFPDGTIHVAVVDPDVGTERKTLLIQTEHAFYIGPDNGVLTLAAKNDGIECVREITNRKFMLPRISTTFHGRDIFAPVAAHLANGTAPEEFGPEIRKIAAPSFAGIVKKENMLVGEVLHVDGFGNVITNFRGKELEAFVRKGIVNVKLKNIKLKLKLSKSYAEAKTQRPVAMIGSHDFLEIAMNQDNAAKHLKTRIGDKVTLYYG